MADPFAGGRRVIFDKYEMGRVLGKGTFAKVYYARNIHTSESVAIKVITKSHLKKEDSLNAQIQREIAVMRLVRHPNIVEIKEVMATKRRIFFVMEYVKGGELFARVARGRLKEETARKYFQQLISAVDFCHTRGVSHRDLKLENLLLDENDSLKVSDFGLSALPEQLRSDGLLHTQCGTPAYVAPEVLRNKGYDGAKADVWSCGVILYVLLAGFQPFFDENLMKMYTRIVRAEFVFPQWFSPDAKRVISRMLEPDPDLRITIQGIMKTPWFRRGFILPFISPKEAVNDQERCLDHTDEDVQTSKSSSPPLYTAFQFISSMSSGFDLTNLFENWRKPGSLFTSKCSAMTAMAKIETLARSLKFKIVSNKHYKLRMQGAKEGRKGKLGVTVEVFEVTPVVAVVEFSKFSGDTWEYLRFCEEDARPALNDIVWSWQGDPHEAP